MKRLVLSLLLTVMALFAAMPLSAQQAKQPAKPVISILGDSYSTFEDYIPLGNETWYNDHLKDNRSDVNDVKQTWWWQVISKGGYILGVNDSYSGSTISYRGYRGEDYRDRSFITRLRRLGSPDIILIFGCTNDSWAGVKVGEYNYSDRIPGDQVYTFRPAMAKLLSEAQNRYPGTKIYFILNSELREDINESVREVCAHYSVPVIELHDIHKIANHPSRAGMNAIAEQVLEALNK